MENKEGQKLRKEINILYDSSFGDLKGGGQRSLLLLLKRLDRRRFVPHLICPCVGELVDEARKLYVKTFIFQFDPLRTLDVLRICRTIKKVKYLIQENNIQVIHTESSRGTFYLGMASRGLKIPLVRHARVSTREPFLYERLLYGLSKRVIAVSRAAGARFGGFAKSDKKVKVIYNAVDTSEFNPELDKDSFRVELGVQDEVLVGIVGEIAFHKGQQDLLSAAAEVLKETTDVRFVIVGDGPESQLACLKKLGKEIGIYDYAVFMDYRKDMPNVMAGLDIVVNASRWEVNSQGEGFSRVIIEAMAAGKPVLATDVGGNPEAVIDRVTGIVVPPGNPFALARGILEMAKDAGKRLDMGRAGRTRVERLFNVERNVSETQRLYENMVRNSSKCHENRS